MGRARIAHQQPRGGPELPTSSLAAVLAAVLVVALVSQAAAIKCYQAPKSWSACWTDPNGEYEPGRALCGAVSQLCSKITEA